MPPEVSEEPIAHQRFASRADFLAPRKFRFDTQTLPISGLEVRYRSLSDADYSEFQLGAMSEDADGNMVDDNAKLATSRARLIALCLVDGDGQRVFSAADVPALAESMDAADSASLYDTLREFCGLNRKRTLEAAKKN